MPGSPSTASAAETRRARRELSVLAVAVVVGASLLLQLGRFVETRFDELGLGLDTVSRAESWTSEKGPAVCTSMQEVGRCLPEPVGVDTRGRRLLWIGYSQLYGINRYRPGERAAPLVLREMLEGEGITLGAVGLGNINPREMLLVYEWARARTRLDAVMVGAWLHGTKEDGLRLDVQPALDDPAIRSRLERLPSGPGIIAQRAGAQRQSGQYGTADAAPEPGFSLQQSVEAAIVRQLEGTAFWRARQAAESKLAVLLRDVKVTVMVVRNRLLGLKAAAWTVQIPPSRHEINLQAFADLLAQARQDGVKAIVYVPPRPVEERFPYDPALYEAYKKRVAELARETGAHFVNLEDAVVGDVWGKIDNLAGEIVTDFTHFTAVAHRRFAEVLRPVVLGALGGRLP